MIRRIEEAMYENGHQLYNQFRLEFAEKITELDNERTKISKKGKKKTKERTKLLLENNQLRLFYMTSAVNNTVRHYKKIYFAEDVYRTNRMLEIESDQTVSQQETEKKRLEQIKGFYDSPFKLDRKYALSYIAQLTRDRLQESKSVVESLFFDKIYNLLLQTDDQETKIKSLEILSNLIHSEEQRLRLAKNDYLKKFYEAYQSDKQVSERILENISWLTTLICFYPDMIEQIIRLKLLDFIIKICGPQFSTEIRSNAVLALSLLTYHDAMFQELIDRGVIDLVMDLCKDLTGEIKVKQYSTLALVHFALNKKSIQTLVDKNVMDLFNSFGTLNDKVIQTNVSWIFLALCNNGITGKAMVESGITRDMFQVSCNQDFKEVRQLVIAGFAELGKCLNLQDPPEIYLTPELMKVKEVAIVGMEKNFQKTAEKTIEILLSFTLSNSEIHQIIAFWALRDYIMLNHEHLIDNINGIVQAFVNGSIYPQEEINTECANAISFLITHQIVYSKNDWIEGGPSNYILDSLMHLTSSTSKFIRTRAFSTLSTLSTYCASYEAVMLQIQRDIKLPQGKISRQYYQFILDRMRDNLEGFRQRHSVQGIEEDYAGLFCLLRIAKEPSQEIIYQASERLYNFVVNQKKDEDKSPIDRLNEEYYIYVFHTLMQAQDHDTLLKILKVIKFYIRYDSPLQKEVINPDTIIWLLNVLEKQKDDKLLCCKASVTLLDIVGGQHINFEYQEVAIIKKYNKALQTLEVFDKHEVEDLSDEDDNVSLKTTKEDMDKAQTDFKLGVEQSNKSEMQEELKLEEESSKESVQNRLHHQNMPLSIDNDAADFMKRLNKKSHATQDDTRLSPAAHENLISAPSDHNKDSSKNIIQQHYSFNLNEENQDQAVAGLVEIAETEEKIDSSSEQESNVKSKNLGDIDQFQGSGEKVKEYDIKKTAIFNQIMIENLEANENPSINSRKQERESVNQSDYGSPSTKYGPRNKFEIRNGYTNVHILKDALVSSKVRQISQRDNAWKTQVHYTLSGLPELGQIEEEQAQNNISAEFPEIDNQHDHRVVLQILRESLIKSFLMIFTNEGSQHLLLNRDLIDIAFNCLEFIDEVSEEAQEKIAKLIGIVYKFPQVHDHMLKDEVVLGVAHLLTKTHNTEIISPTLRACTFLTMTYEFVAGPLSLCILRNLIPLMEILDNPSECTKDIINLVDSVSNLVNGSDLNKLHFYEAKGPLILLKYLSKPQYFDNGKFTEICMNTLKTITELKTAVRALIRDDEEELLKKVLSRCFETSDGWIEEARKRGKKTIQKKSNESRSDLNVMEKLLDDGQGKKTVLFASQAEKIRNYSYFLLARVIKNGGFSFSQVQESCNFTARLMQDLTAHNENHYLFESLIYALEALQDEADFVTKTLLPMQNTIFVLLNDYSDQDHKVTLLKAIVKLLISQVEKLCDIKEGVIFLTRTFKLIENSKSDEEMQESVLFLVNQILEIGETQNVVQVCSQTKVIQTIAELINPEKRPNTLYETIHTLTTLAKEPELLEQFSSTPSIFTKIYNLITHRKIEHHLELRTAIYGLLQVLSAQNISICDILMTQGFGALMFKEIRLNEYIVEKLLVPDACSDGIIDVDITSEEENDREEYNLQHELDKITYQEGPKIISLANIIEDPHAFGLSSRDQLIYKSASGEQDNIEKLQNANLMIEAIIQTFSNIALSTRSNHHKLIDLGLLDDLKSILQLYVSYEYGSPLKQPTEQIDISGLSVGSLNLLKSLTSILHSLTKNIDVQEIILQRDMASILKHSNRLLEYEVLTNTYLSLGNLMLSPLQRIRQRSVELGCLDMLIESNDEAEFLRVRRICNSVLQQTDPRLFEYNESIKSGNA